MPNDPQELLDIIQEQVVIPLEQFPSVSGELDRIHTYYMNAFTTNILSLFEGNPNPAVEGSGADALLQKMDEYIRSEQNETGYGNDGTLSAVINQANELCIDAALNILLLIETFPPSSILLIGIDPVDTPLIQIRASELLIMEGLRFIDDVYRVSVDQLANLKEMGVIRSRWGSQMRRLRDEAILLLPPPPNNLVTSFVTLPTVTLTPQQQQQVHSIMEELAAAGIVGIPQQYIEVLIKQGFSEQDILAAILAWKRAGRSDQEIADLLFLAAFHILLAPYYRPDMVPLGMDAEQYQKFSSTLRSGLRDAGYCVGAGIGGSAVTGFKYINGAPFDSDHQSDYDVAIADPLLLQRAKDMGIRLRDGGTHTEPLKPKQLEALGLTSLVEKLQAISGREVHFMIYNSLTATSARAPYIYTFGNSCA